LPSVHIPYTPETIVGLFDDFNKFLEDRLDEFLKNNPHLELQALEDQLQEQEADTVKLIAEFELKEKQLEAKILELAQAVQLWHGRVVKAEAAGRTTLAVAAKEREAALLQEGNQVWVQRQGVSDRLERAVQLQEEIKQRRQALKVKAAELKAQQAAKSRAADQFDQLSEKFGDRVQDRSQAQTQYKATTSEFDPNYDAANDPLEQAFQAWETEDELEALKRKLN